MGEPKKSRVMEKEKLMKVSSSGRQIKPPKKILPTSSDEEPPKKRNKGTLILDISLEILRAQLKELQNKRVMPNTSLVEKNRSPRVANSGSKSQQTTSKHTEVDCQKIFLQNNAKNVGDSDSPDQNIDLNLASKPILGNPKGPGNESSSVLVSKSVEELQSLSFNQSLKDSIQDENRGQEEMYYQSSEEVEKNSFEKEVLQNLSILRQQNKILIEQKNTIIRELQERNATEGSKLSQNLLGHLTGYPIKTEEEFSKLDALQNKTERKKLYDHLIQLGGSKVREFLSCALKEIMSNGEEELLKSIQDLEAQKDEGSEDENAFNEEEETFADDES